MNPLQHTFRQVKAATTLAPARPAWAAGLRAAVATFVPLLAAHVLGLGEAGTWMSIGGFNGALADRGGPYRARAATLLVLLATSMLAVAAATLAGGHVATAVPVTFGVALLGGLARAWGVPGISVGVSTLSAYVIALGAPPHTAGEAALRAGYLALGALWSMLLSLGLWPLRPFRPARLVVAASYRALAAHAEDVARRICAPAPVSELPAGSGVVRAALEEARHALARMRRGRPGETGRAEQLMLLNEGADQLFGHVVAAAETIDSIPPAERVRAAQHAVADGVAGIAAAARALADAVEAERELPAVAAGFDGAATRAALGAGAVAPVAAAHYRQAAVILDRGAQFVRGAGATAAALESGRAPAGPRAAGEDDWSEPADASAIATLRDVAGSDTLIRRYALRMAVVVSVAVAIATLFGLERGYWMTLTVIVILQPYTGATTHRALQRVLGTVLGGLLTAALGAFFHDPRAILALSFVLAMTCVALLPLNYAVFSVFLTPTFVLLAEASAGDWHLAGTRVVNTLLGGALALLGSRLLWPSPESTRLPGYIAAAVRGARDYLHVVTTRMEDRSEGAAQAIRAARRQVGLATMDAEESFQRLMGEHGGTEDELAAAMLILTTTRRLSGASAALALARHGDDTPAATTRALLPFALVAADVLNDLAAAVVEGRPPRALPELGGAIAGTETLPPLLRTRIERIARLLRMLHHAVSQWVGGAEPAPLAARSA